MSDFFDVWFDEYEGDDRVVVSYEEREGGRDIVFQELLHIVADHLVDLTVVEKMGGFEQTAHVLRNRLPSNKKDRSGDLGEILATEYVEKKTKFSVPIRRLRFKDDRASAMRGDDVLGFRQGKHGTKVLKVEAKSRIHLSPTVLEQAREGLAKHKGRPNPSSLAFLEYILRTQRRDDEAEMIVQLQNEAIPPRNVVHLIFTLSGNDPWDHMNSHSSQVTQGIKLRLRGCHVEQHGDFISQLFEGCLALSGSDGNS